MMTFKEWIKTFETSTTDRSRTQWFRTGQPANAGVLSHGHSTLPPHMVAKAEKALGKGKKKRKKKRKDDPLKNLPE